MHTLNPLKRIKAEDHLKEDQSVLIVIKQLASINNDGQEAVVSLNDE